MESNISLLYSFESQSEPWYWSPGDLKWLFSGLTRLWSAIHCLLWTHVIKKCLLSSQLCFIVYYWVALQHIPSHPNGQTWPCLKTHTSRMNPLLNDKVDRNGRSSARTSIQWQPNRLVQREKRKIFLSHKSLIYSTSTLVLDYRLAPKCTAQAFNVECQPHSRSIYKCGVIKTFQYFLPKILNS